MCKFNIGIDISLSSTAVYISSESDDYIFSYLNDDKVNKWAKKIENINNVKIRRLEHLIKKDNYSDLEVQKLTKYDSISDLIIDDIHNIVEENECEINIEGYSYGSKTSSINDIIALSTLIRLKVLRNLNCNLHIISPNSLKLETCKMSYGLSEIKKVSKKTGKDLKSDFKYVNLDGVAGGSFKKHEMYKAIIEKGIDSLMTPFLVLNKSILEMKKIPSPIDDIIDSIWLSKIIDY